MTNSKMKLNRRKFIGTGIIASAGIAMGKTLAAEETEKKTAGKTNRDHPYNERTHIAMPTNSFGKTGYKVGILSLGCQAAVEKKGKEELAEKIINKALDLGINYLDTAPVYGRGTSQLNVGRVMKTRRSETFLASKTHKRTYDESMKLLEQQLKDLQTDHLDLWQLHNVQRKDQSDKIFADDGALKALIKAKEEGMVRFVGITGHYEPLILLEAIRRFEFDSLLLAINAADPHYLSFKNYLLPEAQKQGIATISMKVATRGRMLSCWNPPPLEDQPERMRTGLQGTISIKEALTYNMSLPVSTTIIGVDSVDQIEENVKIASEFSPLSNEEMAAIEYKTLPIVRQGLYFRRWNLGV